MNTNEPIAPIRCIALLQACWICLFASSAIAQETAESPAGAPESLLGTWKLVSIASADKELKTLDVRAVIEAGTFRLEGADIPKRLTGFPELLQWRIPKSPAERPYRQLREGGVKGIDDIVDVENQISVFWFIGIYRFHEKRLELALAYCGQGLEGKRLENFRPPSTFDAEPGDDELRIVLERFEGAADAPRATPDPEGQ